MNKRISTSLPISATVKSRKMVLSATQSYPVKLYRVVTSRLKRR